MKNEMASWPGNNPLALAFLRLAKKKNLFKNPPD
jgi:hypothetical protein